MPSGNTILRTSHFLTALEIRLQAFPDDHPSIAESYNDLAINLASQGKFAEAQQWHEKALDIQRRRAPRRHIRTSPPRLLRSGTRSPARANIPTRETVG